MTTVEDLKTLVDRIDGKADRMAAVDRLRAYIADPETFEYLHVDDAEEINELLLEASSGIDALLARLASAEKALKPFSDELDDWSSIENDGYEYDEDYPLSDRDGDLTVGHLRAARAHLSQYGERT